MLGWLIGALVAVILEHLVGDPLTDLLGLPKIPVLFGFVTVLKKPHLIPSILIFVFLIYILPISVVAKPCRTV